MSHKDASFYQPSNSLVMKNSGNVFGTLPPSLVGTQMGVWRIVEERNTGRSWNYQQKPTLSGFNPLLGESYPLRFLADVYRLSPALFVLYVITYVLLGVNDALKLQFMNRLFEHIEQTFKTGNSDARGIVCALSLRLGSVAFDAVVHWIQERIELILDTHVKNFCRDVVMQNHLSSDLLSSQNSTDIMGRHLPNIINYSLRTILDMFQTSFSTVAQLFVILRLLGTQDNSFTLILLCLAQPLLTPFIKNDLWGQNAIYYASNLKYRRILTMYDIATDTSHRQEIISGGMKGWITDEYRSANQHLKHTTDTRPNSMRGPRSTPAAAAALALSQDLPLAFCVITAIISGRSISLTFLATLQQMTTSLRAAIESLALSTQSIGEAKTFLESLYTSHGKPAIDLKRGTQPYPATEKHDGGMSIEFRNVAFKYPGSKDDVLAVNNVSFKLPPSSLVVIVGENGSGKSSIVKMLTQLYAPSAGSILVDGADSQSYRKNDLYAATALLTQDHTIFPLSIAENIGLGDPNDVKNMPKVVKAAKLGGASDFIEKRVDQYDEVLHPLKTSVQCRHPLPEGPVKAFAESIERATEISGGEKQRLAASRTFMRLMSDKIKLVVVDEPTSAMDPTGEFELFETLRSMRAGKTMVFVTHRFGHLTKHADLILCMKDGALVESGTHRTLMALNGAYTKLYDVQARAFADDAEPK